MKCYFSTMLRMFYQCYLLCCLVQGQQGEGSRCQQNQLAYQEGWLCPGVKLDSLVVVSERRMRYKLRSIMDGDSHPP